MPTNARMQRVHHSHFPTLDEVAWFAGLGEGDAIGELATHGLGVCPEICSYRCPEEDHSKCVDGPLMPSLQQTGTRFARPVAVIVPKPAKPPRPRPPKPEPPPDPVPEILDFEVAAGMVPPHPGHCFKCDVRVKPDADGWFHWFCKPCERGLR